MIPPNHILTPEARARMEAAGLITRQPAPPRGRPRGRKNGPIYGTAIGLARQYLAQARPGSLTDFAAAHRIGVNTLRAAIHRTRKAV